MSELRCPACRESIPAGVTVCPHCAEPLSHGRDTVGFALAGLALGLFLLGLVARLGAGPLPDAASAARSLRFLEMVGASCFLLLLASTVRRG